MTILEATKIEGYLTAEPCRDLAQAKPGQLAITGKADGIDRDYIECIVEIAKVYKNGNIVLVGGNQYKWKWDGAKDMQRTGAGNWKNSLRPFKEGETVESFLAAQEASRLAKEADAEAAANAKEAEHQRRLAALGGLELWERREENVYEDFEPDEPVSVKIVTLFWRDERKRYHVTHCYIPAPVEDWNGKRQYWIKIWDVDANQTGAGSVQGEDPRDAIERWIAQNYA